MEKHVAIIGDHEYRFEQTEGGYTVCVSGESSSGFSICLRIFSHKKRKMAMAYWRGITAAGSFMGNLSYPGDPDMSDVDMSGIDLRGADLSPSQDDYVESYSDFVDSHQ